MHRTLKLTEHEPSNHLLADEQLDDVLASGLVDVGALGNSLYRLRPGSIVGNVTLGSLRLIIHPKVAAHTLISLLGYAAGITKWREEPFPYDSTADLVPAMVTVYAAEVEFALRRGLVRDYQSKDEGLVAPRGRLRFDRQLSRWQGRPYPVECTYDEFTEDIELNRLIKRAHAVLLGWPLLSPHLQARLRRQHLAFTDVENVEYFGERLPELQLTRLTDHWSGALELARLIVSRRSITNALGGTWAPGVTVDMNDLFELFITAIVREEADAAHLQMVPQAPRAFSADVGLRPDLIIRVGGKDAAVADVKYKETKSAEWPHANLYQMLAYCSVLGLPRGLLIYAGERVSEVQTVKRSGVELEVIGVPLDGSWREVLAGARKAAKRLVSIALGTDTASDPDQENNLVSGTAA